ncbi:hypothetical protein TWF281_006869 [Arthrobotrys megalospora]
MATLTAALHNLAIGDTELNLPKAEPDKIQRARYMPSRNTRRPKNFRSARLPVQTTEKPLPAGPEDQKSNVDTKPDQTKSTTAGLLTLPLEVHEKILEYLPYEEHFTLAQVCPAWMAALQTDKFAVKRYRTVRPRRDAGVKEWSPPTLCQQYQRATTNFLLYNQKLFFEMYRDEPNTATLILFDDRRFEERGLVSPEEERVNERRDKVVYTRRAALLQNRKYVEIQGLEMFGRDTLFFVGQDSQLSGEPKHPQSVAFTKTFVDAHNYSLITDRSITTPLVKLEVPNMMCYKETSLKELMDKVNEHVMIYVLEKSKQICGCVAFLSSYSKGGTYEPSQIIIHLVVLVVEPQHLHLYVQNEAGYYTAQPKDTFTAQSFNFGYSSPKVSFISPRKPKQIDARKFDYTATDKSSGQLDWSITLVPVEFVGKSCLDFESPRT